MGNSWKLEAWKAALSFVEKLFFLFLGVLVLPTLIGKISYPLLALIFGILCVTASGTVWIILILYGYKREE